MTFVLDASVTLAWCFDYEDSDSDDEDSDYADRVLHRLHGSEAFVTHLWGLEVANGLLVAERRGRIAPTEIARLQALLLSLPIAVDPVARRRAFASVHPVARSHGLSAYDASYLELAVRRGMPIATLDASLGRAAGAEGPGRFLP